MATALLVDEIFTQIIENEDSLPYPIILLDDGRIISTFEILNEWLNLYVAENGLKFENKIAYDSNLIQLMPNTFLGNFPGLPEYARFRTGRRFGNPSLSHAITAHTTPINVDASTHKDLQEIRNEIIQEKDEYMNVIQAIILENYSILGNLLKSGASLTRGLNVAGKRKDYEMIQYFMENGADPQAIFKNSKLFDPPVVEFVRNYQHQKNHMNLSLGY